MVTGAELQRVSPPHPVRRAYALRPYHDRSSLEGGKPSCDQTAVLVAVRGPQPELWDVVDGGRVVVDSEGHTHWTPDSKGRHAYLKIKGREDRLETIIGELMTR